MSNNPINLALRFFLELAALVALGYWGFTQNQGIMRVILGLGIPLLAAALWGTFRTPSDHGKGIIAVPGIVRLLLEAAFFGAAVWLLAAADQPNTALIFGVVIVGHYLVSYDRVLRLLKQR